MALTRPIMTWALPVSLISVPSLSNILLVQTFWNFYFSFMLLQLKPQNSCKPRKGSTTVLISKPEKSDFSIDYLLYVYVSSAVHYSMEDNLANSWLFLPSTVWVLGTKLIKDIKFSAMPLSAEPTYWPSH